MCGSRKYPYPPPPQQIIGNSEGEGGLKGSYFGGVGGGFMETTFPEHEQNIEKNVQSIVSSMRREYFRSHFLLNLQKAWLPGE